MSSRDNREAISFLVSGAPVLAAGRRKSGDIVSVRRKGSTGPDAFEAVALENLLLELSGNPLLAIVVRSLGIASICAEADPMPPVDRRDVIAINRRILQAIDAGDVSTAGVLARVKLEVMRRPAQHYYEVA